MNRKYTCVVIRKVLLRYLLLIGVLVGSWLSLCSSQATAYAAGATEFGMQIDTHDPAKIPNLTQLQLLNPMWVRADYSKITFSSPWPSSVKTIVLVNNETTHSHNPGLNTPFSIWQAYVDTVYVPRLQQILQESPAVPAIEVWNEEDVCSPGFCPYVPAREYAYLLDRAVTTIKSINPATKVIMGGMASGKVSYLSDVMKADPAGFSKIDAVGLHPYGTSPDGWCASGCSGGTLPFGDLATVVTNYQTAAGKPIWVTEIGTGSSDMSWQAEYLWRCFTVLQRLQVPVVIWYAWIDTMNPYFGLMNAHGIMKPSGAVFRSFNLQLPPFMASS
jgi:hypothetical protein